jgi:HEAT repeat protein
VERPSRLDDLRTLRNANLDMAFAVAFVTLTTGPFLVGFIQYLGGSDLWIGLLSAIPSLVGILQIPGAIWGRGFASFKPFVTPGGAAWRLLYLPIVFLPFLPWDDSLRLTIFAVLVTVASCCVTLVNPTYSDWLAELVPGNSRGAYFARRNAIGAAVGAVLGIVGAIALDLFRGRNLDAQGFGFVFALGLGCAAVSMVFYLRMTDVPRPVVHRQSLADGLRAIRIPFEDATYRRVLGFLGVSVLGQMFAGNLYVAYGREVLHLEFTILQAMAIFMAVGNIASAPVWGFLADRYGNRPMLTLGLLLIATNPIAWLLCVPGQNVWNSALLLSTHVIMGISWAGVTLCQFNLMLATAKPEDRSNYLGAGMTVIAVVGGLSPLLGSALMAGLRPWLGVDIAYRTVFVSVIFLRVFSSLFLSPVRESGASGFRQTMRDLRTLSPRSMRAMHRLSRGAGADERAEAIETVGRHGAHFASDEIIKALHDPLPAVRRRAAAAIAHLNDPRAVDELVHQLQEHPDLAEEEVVEALGQLGDARAVPALLGLLGSPRSLLRRAAARSLGRIGALTGAVPIQPLVQAAQDPDDVDLRRAALQALRVVGDPHAAPAVLAGVADPHPSVRIAAAEAAAELGLKEAAPALREALARFSDEACAEVAYALGAVGDPQDLPTVLAEAARSGSVITRRRSLLGAARILGAERTAYRLLLAEGMDRDRLMMDLTRNDRRAREAVQVAGAKGEAAGIAHLAALDRRLEAFSARPVEEGFSVALAGWLRASPPGA